MSDNILPSSYPKCFEYEHQFRVLVMHLVMDNLSLEQIERYFFVYNLPERLRDHGRERIRSELLAYINEQKLDKWRNTPSELQDVLKTIGRPDLSTKVEELVGKSDRHWRIQQSVLFARILPGFSACRKLSCCRNSVSGDYSL